MASFGTFVNLHAFDPDDWRRQLDHARELEHVGHLELWLEFIPERRQLAEMADIFDGWHTIMHGPFIGLSLATGWEDLASVSLDRCLRAVEVGGYLGCEMVTFHAGAVQRGEPAETTLERLAGRVDALRRSASLVVTMENMSARGGASREAVACTDDVAALAELLPDLKWTFDVGHCWQNGEDPVAFLEGPLASRIALVHLHDAVSGGRGHLRLGEGTLDFAAVVRAVRSLSNPVKVSLETIGAADTAASWQKVSEVSAEAVFS